MTYVMPKYTLKHAVEKADEMRAMMRVATATSMDEVMRAMERPETGTYDVCVDTSGFAELTPSFALQKVALCWILTLTSSQEGAGQSMLFSSLS